MHRALLCIPLFLSCIETEVKNVGIDDTGDTSVQSDDTDDSGGETDPEPTITGLVLSPDPVSTDDLLVAEASTDDGTDASTEVRWSWTVNEESVDESSSELSGESWFDKGDVVEVFATPYVDDVEGETLSASIVVSNTAPTAPTVQILPVLPIEAEDALVCAVSAHATDADSADALSYSATWTVDGVAFEGATETTFAGDTISETETVAGQIWECTVTAEDDEEAGPSGTDQVEIQEPEVTVAECSTSLGSLSAPTEVATMTGGGSYGIGAWMSDADPTGSEKYWTMMDYDGDQIGEYDSYADVESGSASRWISLDEDWAGTGHVVLNGVLYYNEDDSPTLVALDLATEVELAREDLPDAGYDNTWQYSWGGLTDIDLSVDEERLYAVYSTEAAGGLIVVSELDPTTLEVLVSYTAASALKTDFTNTFIACGVLYGVDSEADAGPCFYCTDTTIDLAWNLYLGTVSDPEISFTAPGSSGYIGSVDYNPADGMIYVLRGGALGLIEPSWD